MRPLRILIGIMAIALLGLGLPAPPASAAPELPKRTITSTVVDKGATLVFKGNVSPGHASKPVFIQKKKCKGDSCHWFRFATVVTNDKGGFHRRITAPRKGYWYWRAKVKAHGGYGTSFSEVWRSYTV